MSAPPNFDIDPLAFKQDPYPALAQMRSQAPVCFVPQLNATLLTKRDDIFTCEKNIDIFSSQQPGGLMTVLMGENMMRKDGEAHLTERKQMFPSVSPRTVRDHWKAAFKGSALEILDGLAKHDEIDLCTQYAMPLSGHALRVITGLTNLTAAQMDFASQGMIDGVGNYGGDAQIEARCHEATTLIDNTIDELLPQVSDNADLGMLSVLTQSGQSLESVRANIKLAISGGQNEPRDAIAGTIHALLNNPDQLAMIGSGEATWLQAFEEYARWMSPIGMSPRRIASPFTWRGVELEEDSRAFLMFGSANRDEDIFDDPDTFDITRDTSKAISFGAGPHFCAGAAASRTLIAEVALPMIFERFPNMQLAGNVVYDGWAFRGPASVPVRL